ncbi:unnamed protein product [Bursaphelenchus xylophilus]|uniref:(pine wood nematode) hypothetical protein n=1 Tax=Bursaphelenchus xylophilus TaxID=6326 RepID=A0A1I7SSU8_BURXY|nr:unnamed protein product [Bursaphelenchus xylophilus]CAG9108874.1 unnamed protein product [Bursaphelenchus xylophilus]
MSREYCCSIVQIGDHSSASLSSSLFKFSDFTPNSVCDLWNPGVYSNFDLTRLPQKPFQVSQKSLNRRHTLQSDSGNESVDTNFSEDESVGNVTKKIVKAVTIYDLKKHELKNDKKKDLILNIYVNPDLSSERRIEARNRRASEEMNEDYKVVPWGLESRPVGKIRNIHKYDNSTSVKSKDGSVSLHTSSDSQTDHQLESDESGSYEKAKPLIVDSVTIRNPRTPIWKSKFLDNKEKISEKMDSGISAASFTFYDQYGVPQESLSQRVSAHLLRKSAIRSSIPRGRSHTVLDCNNKCDDKPALSFQHDKIAVYPRRPQIFPEQKRRSLSVHSRPREKENVITVHGKTKCSSCQYQLGRGQAMVISDLNLFYHMGCFVCGRCKVPLNDDRAQGDLAVRVFDDQLRCRFCFDRSEAGFKSSRI